MQVVYENKEKTRFIIRISGKGEDGQGILIHHGRKTGPFKIGSFLSHSHQNEPWLAPSQDYDAKQLILDAEPMPSYKVNEADLFAQEEGAS